MAASGLIWIKLLSFVATLNVKFALYTHTLWHISSALRSFLCILAIVLGAFAHMFFITMSLETKSSDIDDIDGNSTLPFRTISQSLLTCFRMLLGDFDPDWFRLPSSSQLSALSFGLFVACEFIRASRVDLRRGPHVTWVYPKLLALLRYGDCDHRDAQCTHCGK